MDKTVLNLSICALTKDQLSVLAKGLNFCPTPTEPDPGQYKIDLDSLHRRLRLRAKFQDLDDDTNDFDKYGDPLHNIEPFEHRNFKMKSTYNPVGPANLEAFIAINDHNFNKRAMFKGNREKNLTPGEFKAISELQNLADKIIIRPADKGSAVVVQDRETYIAEANRQLTNPMFYMKVEEDLTPKHRGEVLAYIDKMFEEGDLDVSVVNYLHEQENKTARFYLLPKIHKGISPPPGRPIVSANGCATERISQLVDHFLNPLSSLHKSYVRDTTHFLNILKKIGTVPSNSLLVTFDVCSLYTNIPIKEGIQAARESLDKHRHKSAKPKNQSIIQLLEFVLTKNNFKFNDEHFLQMWGTCMGSKCAPSFADLYMNWFETKFIYSYPIPAHTWVRYLDDCFCL
jgi:hypothetical protein